MPIFKLTLVAASFTAIAATAALAEDPARPFPDGLQQVEDFWRAHGAPPQVAMAWAAEVDRESGGDPTRVGDFVCPKGDQAVRASSGNIVCPKGDRPVGTSFGAYQHHNDRARTLLLNIENNEAFDELLHDDPIAAAHRDEIMNAPDQAAAQAAIKRWFFRPKGSQSIPPPQFVAALRKEVTTPKPTHHFNPFVSPFTNTTPETVFDERK